MTAGLTALGGIWLAAAILGDAFETVLVPRRIGRRVRLTRYFYLFTWPVWRSVALAIRKHSRREALLGFYGPSSLILLLVCWALGLIVAFALLQVAALGVQSLTWRQFGTVIYLSGETFFTLGFGDITPVNIMGRVLSVLEAGMGFGFLGTVVGYLPTMYAGFAQREVEIALLDARAGSPPTAAEFLRRMPAENPIPVLNDAMRDWERWSAQLLETHISYPQLAYYRSQHANQSWLGSLTAVLDASAIVIALDDPRNRRQAKMTFAMARHALVDITQIFVTRYVPARVTRLTPEQYAALGAVLAPTPMRLPEGDAFGEHLAELRLLYEPYAESLASYLLIDLPPWAHLESRRDNWRGGPWDRTLAIRHAAEHSADDHF